MKQPANRFPNKQVTLAVLASLALTQPFFAQSAMAQQADEEEAIEEVVAVLAGDHGYGSSVPGADEV